MDGGCLYAFICFVLTSNVHDACVCAWGVGGGGGGEGGGGGVTEAELKQQGTNCTGMARAAQGTVRWRGVVDGLCFIGSDGHK